MTVAFWVPLLLPFVAVALAGRLAGRLAPRRAALLLAGTGAVLAASVLAVLGLLVFSGVLHLPFVAALGHLSASRFSRGAPWLGPLAGVAGLWLVVSVACAGGLARRVAVQLHSARARADAVPCAGDLVVLPDDGADAFALPAWPGRPGRVVVTAGMLRVLSAPEREVLLAHERAHLAHHHHLYLGLARFAGCAHPALRALVGPLSFALERWADECAASAVADRRLAARAVGRAALAVPSGARHGRALALSVAAGPVPQRMAALLGPSPDTGRPRGRLALALVAAAACAALSAGAALDTAGDVHERIETAQQPVSPV